MGSSAETADARYVPRVPIEMVCQDRQLVDAELRQVLGDLDDARCDSQQPNSLRWATWHAREMSRLSMASPIRNSITSRWPATYVPATKNASGLNATVLWLHKGEHVACCSSYDLCSGQDSVTHARAKRMR